MKVRKSKWASTFRLAPLAAASVFPEFETAGLDAAASEAGKAGLRTKTGSAAVVDEFSGGTK